MSMPSSGSSTKRSASVTSSFVGMPTGYKRRCGVRRARLKSGTGEKAVVPASAAKQRPLKKPHLLAALAREEVDPVHEAHPIAARAHDERVRPRTVSAVAHPAQKVAVRDARGRDDHLVRRQVVDREDLLDVVDPVLAGALDLAAGRRPELGLHLAAEAP